MEQTQKGGDRSVLSVLAAMEGQEKLVFTSSLTIGRHPLNDAVLGHPRISSRHAVVEWDGSRWVIKDLGSRNGTTVNGRRIRSTRSLKEGDEIRFGSVSGWRVEVLSTPAEPPSVLAYVDIAASSLRMPVTTDRFLIGTRGACDLVVPEWRDEEQPAIRLILYAESGSLWAEPVSGVPGIAIAGGEDAWEPVRIEAITEVMLGPTGLKLTPVTELQELGRTETAGHRPKYYDLDLHLTLEGPAEGTLKVIHGGEQWSVTTGQRFMLLYLLARTGGGWLDDLDLRMQLWGRIGTRDMDPSSLHKLIHDTRQMFLAHGIDGWFIEKSQGRTRLRLESRRIHVHEPPQEGSERA